MSAKRTVLIPLPDTDFDTTEVAVPWRLLTNAGHEVIFATQHGDRIPSCDQRLLTGVIFGQLGAALEAITFYRDLEQQKAFRNPVKWSEVNLSTIHGLLLPGGHAPGMKQYLGDQSLQRVVGDFWATNRPVGAICHGTVVLARSIAKDTHNSVLYGKRTTCLPLYMEALAFGLTAWKLGRYYRTYPQYVETEVRSALRSPVDDFIRGPITLGARGTAEDDTPAFVVQDGNYLSARWPGDAYLFSKRFIELLERHT